MKVLLTGKNSNNIAGLVKSFGFEVVDSNPDVIISYGGDGTLLSSEREYPGIPKLPIRNSQFCHKCPEHEDKTLLEKLSDSKLQLKEYAKLETEVLYKKFYALNDFVIRNQHPIHAIRFKVILPLSPRRMSGSINNTLYIGDGVVISTPFGSSGYFKSITGQTFNQGFGVAFNNITEKVEPLILKDAQSLTFKLIRGKATLSFDNSSDIFNIAEGSELIFKLSDQVAKIYEDTSLRCPNCQVIRG